MAPLDGGGEESGVGAQLGSGSGELRKKMPPARERAFFSER